MLSRILEQQNKSAFLATYTNFLFVSVLVFCFTQLTKAQNGMRYEPLSEGLKNFYLEKNIKNRTNKNTKTTEKKSRTHFVENDFIINNKPFINQSLSYFLKSKELEDTLKWNAHQLKESMFAAAGAPPVVKRLMIGHPLTPSDSSELQNQKRFSYHLLADFISYISGQPVEYLNEIEEIVSEEALIVDSELFFNHQDSTIEFLDRLNLENNIRKAYSDKEMVARFKAIEKEVPFNYTPEVRNFIEKYGVRYYTYTNTLIAKSNEYFPLFEEILKEHDMPEELKYLVVVESAFKTQVRSHAGAVGLWQFMPRTGKIFGLNQNFYIDERMNPTSSTIAACKYLKYLNKFFDGDWELAIAAYNCGPGNVKKAMRRSGKTKFWDIYNYLPRETRAYVPLYTTYAYLFNYAEDHGMVVEDPIYAIEYDTVYVSQYVNLDKLADELRMCATDLKAMNPEAKRGIIPHYAKDHPIRIPKNRSDYFWKGQEQILLACQNKNYKSKATNSTASRTANTRKSSNTTAQSYTASSSNNYRKTSSRSYSGKKTYHTVSKGETLGGIAVKYGTSVSSLRRWNGIYGSRINIGQKLVMYNIRKGTQQSSKTYASSKKSTKPSTQSKSTSSYKTGSYHVVRQGDTLWGIANSAGITVSKLKSLNNLRSDKLSIGQKLRIM